MINLKELRLQNNYQYEKDEDGVNDDYDRPIPGTGFTGVFYVPAYMCCVFADIHLCVAGELPKELGKLVNLKSIFLEGTGLTGTIVCPIIHTNKCI